MRRTTEWATGDRVPHGEGGSLHGAPGWTRRSGVEALLAPHTVRGPGRGADFTRVEGIGGETALRLLDLLPGANLDERQNGGPTCRAMLRAAGGAGAGVELSGYLVSAPRWDERVGLDGMVVPGNLLRRLPDTPLTAGPWETIRAALDLGAGTRHPDELVAFLPRDGDVGEDEGVVRSLAWWLWWD